MPALIFLENCFGDAEANRKVYAALLELLYTKTTIMVTERERLKSEIEIASRIQTGFLPKSFDRFCELPDVKSLQE